jgi:hypothetical protein
MPKTRLPNDVVASAQPVARGALSIWLRANALPSSCARLLALATFIVIAV